MGVVSGIWGFMLEESMFHWGYISFCLEWLGLLNLLFNFRLGFLLFLRAG